MGQEEGRWEGFFLKYPLDYPRSACIVFSCFIVFVFFFSCGNIEVKISQNQTKIRKTDVQKSAKWKEGLGNTAIIIRGAPRPSVWQGNISWYRMAFHCFCPIFHFLFSSSSLPPFSEFSFFSPWELSGSPFKAGPPWFEFLVIFDFFASWYRKSREASSVKILQKNSKEKLVKCAIKVARLQKVSIQSCTQKRPSPKVQSLSRDWI